MKTRILTSHPKLTFKANWVILEVLIWVASPIFQIFEFSRRNIKNCRYVLAISHFWRWKKNCDVSILVNSEVPNRAFNAIDAYDTQVVLFFALKKEHIMKEIQCQLCDKCWWTTPYNSLHLCDAFLRGSKGFKNSLLNMRKSIDTQQPFKKGFLTFSSLLKMMIKTWYFKREQTSNLIDNATIESLTEGISLWSNFWFLLSIYFICYCCKIYNSILTLWPLAICIFRRLLF